MAFIYCASISVETGRQESIHPVMPADSAIHVFGVTSWVPLNTLFLKCILFKGVQARREEGIQRCGEPFLSDF